MTLMNSLKCCAVVAALCAATASSAQSYYYSEVNANANAIGFGSIVQPPGQYDGRSSDVPFAGLTALGEANLTNAALGAALLGTSVASSSTQTGGLHLLAVSTASVMANAWSLPNPNASGSAAASSSFRDVLTFDVPGAAPDAVFWVNALVRVDVQNSMDGSLVGTTAPSFVSAASAWTTNVSMATSLGFVFQDQRQSDCSWGGQMTCTGSQPGLVPVSFTVTNQDRVVLSMSANVKASAGAYLAGPGMASMGATLDMGNTLAWGGVQGVSDANGNAVTNFSLVGLGSGFDFRNAYVSAVPEPASALLTLAGVLVLLGARRRVLRGN